MLKKFARKIYSAVPLKQELFTLFRGLYIPSETVYRHLHFIGEFDVKVDEKCSFQMRHYGFEVENTLFWEGRRGGCESTALSAWCELAKSAKTIFDIGANTGVYSLAAKAVSPEARVIALEPIVRIYEKLVANNSMNDFDIECILAAASDEDGNAVILNSSGPHSYSATFHNEIFTDIEMEPVEAQVRCLSSVIEERSLPGIDLMKIDVEGHEPAVLRGMGKYLRSYRPTILIEILTDDVGSEVTKIIGELGYKKLYIDERNNKLFQVDGLTRRENYNYLLYNEECGPLLNLSFDK